MGKEKQARKYVNEVGRATTNAVQVVRLDNSRKAIIVYGLEAVLGGIVKLLAIWSKVLDISTTSNIYTHLDFSSKVASANAIMDVYPS